MPLSIQRPAPIDVTKSNPNSRNYITTDDTFVDPGDNVPNGSIRLQFTPGETQAHLELKTNGVWNDTGLRLASSSLQLGRDMTVSSVAGFLETLNPSATVGHQKTLIPHMEFVPEGTLEHGHLPILDKLATFDTFPGPAIGQSVGTAIGQILSGLPGRALKTSTHEVGTVGATAQVTVSFYIGTDNTGTLIFKRNFGANTFVADSPFIIDYDEDFGFEGSIPVFQEFTSANNISLKTNMVGDVITTETGHLLDEIEIVSAELVMTDNLGFIFNNEREFVTHQRFDP